jgi:hypothetical protein
MKSIFFHLMPYRDLPADFETKYDSIWVTPPNSELCDPKKVAQYYQWNLDELELADRLGFDGVGVNEHHQNGYGFMASPNLMAAALARRTPNGSALMVLGNTLALYSPATGAAAAASACLPRGSGDRLPSRDVDPQGVHLAPAYPADVRAARGVGGGVGRSRGQARDRSTPRRPRRLSRHRTRARVAVRTE